MSKKKIIKGIILFVLYCCVFAFLIWYVICNADMMKNIVASSRVFAVVGISSSAISVALTGLMDVSCARVYNVRIKYLESIGLTYIAATINLFLPLQLGSIIKAVYLKKRMALSYSKYISIVSGTVIINMIISMFQLLVCFIFTAIGNDVDSIYIWLVAVVLFVFCCGIIVFVKCQSFVLSVIPFKKYLLPIAEGFFVLISNKRAMILVFINLLVSSVLGGFRFTCIFRTLGSAGNVVEGLMFYGLYASSTVLPILPGNIGLSEAIVGITNTILGADFDLGVTAVLINRIYYYLVAIIGTILSAFPLWKRYCILNREEIDNE